MQFPDVLGLGGIGLIDDIPTEVEAPRIGADSGVAPGVCNPRSQEILCRNQNHTSDPVRGFVPAGSLPRQCHHGSGQRAERATAVCPVWGADWPALTRAGC